MGIKSIENEFHRSAIHREARAVQANVVVRIYKAVTAIFRDSAFAEHAERVRFEREVAKFRANTNTFFPGI